MIYKGVSSRFRYVLLFIVSAICGPNWALTIPERSNLDERVRYVDYRADDVVVVMTARGVVTRIVLGEGEQIVRPVDTGFVSNCEDLVNEWCIHADLGQNQITVKPRAINAAQNNLEVTTNKRDYSFVLMPLKGNEKAKGVFYRVIFRYPMPPLPSTHGQVVSGVPGLGEPTISSKKAPNSKYIKPTVRNVDYSYKAIGASQSLLPSIVFDDGRFTYFKFERAREIPAVFATDANGEEVRVAFHAERLLASPEDLDAEVERDYLVLNRVSRVWRLRIEGLVAEVINNNYDPKGIETYNGTTVPTMRRESK